MRILLIEDDNDQIKTVQNILHREGFIVDATDLGQDGVEIGKLYDYDLIILDIILPDIDGFDVLKRLRAANIKTPVLVLSGLYESCDKVKCLDIGADDYLTKPFNSNELVARIQAIVRRNKGHSEAVIKIGRMTVNLNTQTVSIDNKPLNLTGKEYAIIELLALRKGATLTKEMFLNHLYGGLDEPEIKIIDVFVCKLRKKLMKYLDGENYIETVWGRGYVLKEPDPVESDLLQMKSRAL